MIDAVSQARPESGGGWHVLDANGFRKCDPDEPGAVYLSNSGRVIECTPSIIVPWRR